MACYSWTNGKEEVHGSYLYEDVKIYTEPACNWGYTEDIQYPSAKFTRQNAKTAPVLTWY